MNTLKLSLQGYDLIKHYESLHDGDLTQIGLQPKMCPAGVWTIGWGHAVVYKGRLLKGEQNKKLALSLYPDLSEDEADKLLIEDAQLREKQVNDLGLQLEQYEFDSLVSFVFNEGIGNLKTSTLLKRIIAKKNKEHVTNDMIKEAFGRFKYASGIVLPGLVYRRKTEAELFINNILTFFN
jgi:lysozyme